jgi:hypothetical protein
LFGEDGLSFAPPDRNPWPPSSHLVLYPVPVGPGQVRPKYRDAQPPQVQAAFKFLLATATHEAGKFELVSVAEVDGRWHYTFSGADEVFDMVRPESKHYLPEELLEKTRATR